MGDETEAKTYTTKDDAIEQYVVPALGDYADDHDLDAIFDDCFEYNQAIDEDGVEHLNSSGFRLTADEAAFWESVQRHDIGSEKLLRILNETPQENLRDVLAGWNLDEAATKDVDPDDELSAVVLADGRGFRRDPTGSLWQAGGNITVMCAIGSRDRQPVTLHAPSAGDEDGRLERPEVTVTLTRDTLDVGAQGRDHFHELEGDRHHGHGWASDVQCGCGDYLAPTHWTHTIDPAAVTLHLSADPDPDAGGANRELLEDAARETLEAALTALMGAVEREWIQKWGAADPDCGCPACWDTCEGRCTATSCRTTDSQPCGDGCDGYACPLDGESDVTFPTITLDPLPEGVEITLTGAAR